MFSSFGGESNPSRVETLVQKGDAIIIPAGAAHKLLDDLNGDFQMVGSYPKASTLMCVVRRVKKRRKSRAFPDWSGLRGIPCTVTRGQI